MPAQGTKPAAKATAKNQMRRVTRYTDELTMRKLKDNDARPTSKRGMLLAALLPCRTMGEARKAFSEVHYEGPQIPFASFMRWMVVNKYVGLNAKESVQQTTTVRLPKRLYEEARSIVENGETEARSLNDFIVAAIRTSLKMYERKQIDAAFAGMAGDADYQRDANLMAKEFAHSDWEALRLKEEDLNI